MAAGNKGFAARIEIDLLLLENVATIIMKHK